MKKNIILLIFLSIFIFFNYKIGTDLWFKNNHLKNIEINGKNVIAKIQEVSLDCHKVKGRDICNPSISVIYEINNSLKIENILIVTDKKYLKGDSVNLKVLETETIILENSKEDLFSYFKFFIFFNLFFIILFSALIGKYIIKPPR